MFEGAPFVESRRVFWIWFPFVISGPFHGMKARSWIAGQFVLWPPLHAMDPPFVHSLLPLCLVDPRNSGFFYNPTFTLLNVS